MLLLLQLLYLREITSFCPSCGPTLSSHSVRIGCNISNPALVRSVIYNSIGDDVNEEEVVVSLPRSKGTKVISFN